MSESTRNPTGYGENVTLLGVFFSVGLWLGGLVDDPNLGTAIHGATVLAGKVAQTFAANLFGAPLASALGAGAMKGARVGTTLLLLMALGCGYTIGPQGLQGTMGDTDITITDKSVPGKEVKTRISGKPISIPGASIFTGAIYGALSILSGGRVPMTPETPQDPADVPEHTHDHDHEP